MYRDSDLADEHSRLPCDETAGDSRPLEVFDTALTSNQVRAVISSRCYFNKTPDKPLAGARIVIKDNLDIAGFTTSI
jgi:Asp-tRNA(Asn)/Glu-tRNA(Gln) amidotransferase A subunit family amidase